jgi:hypothetical protein
MKQTAVEWLIEELQKANYIPKDSIIMDYVIKQAKEMEKQQIIEAFNLGQQEEAKQPFWTKGNEYYEKNF